LWTFLHACVLVTAGVLMPFPRRFAVARAYARGVLRVLKWSCGLDYRVEGAPLPAGSHVALWKHSSSWETIAMMVLFPRQVWVLKRELLWVPVVGPAVKGLHAIAIDRTAGHSAVAQVIEQGKQRLDEGDWVMIFPEGTRMAPGETRRYGVSGTLLASEAGKLIVPVAHNAGFYWPRRGLRKKPGTVRVVIGAAVTPGSHRIRSGSDIEIGNREGVLLDELAARLDLISHERHEDIVGGERVLDLHLQQAARLGIDRGLPELLRIHLAESLVALDRLALLRLIEKPLHRLLEGADVLAVLAAHHEGSLPDEPRERAREIRDALVLGGFEELARQVLVARRAVLALVYDDARRVPVARRPRLHAVGAGPVGERVETLIEVLRPAAQPLGAVEVRRSHLRHVDELLEEPIAVAARPAPDDRLHFHVFARERLEPRARERRSLRVDV